MKAQPGNAEFNLDEKVEEPIADTSDDASNLEVKSTIEQFEALINDPTNFHPLTGCLLEVQFLGLHLLPPRVGPLELAGPPLEVSLLDHFTAA